MKTAIVGPGAMGCLFAFLLSSSKDEIWLFDHRADRAERIKKEGIVVERDKKEFRFRPMITSTADEVGKVELLIIFVKAYDTKSAIEHALPLVNDSTSVLSLQNGHGNVDILMENTGRARVLGGTTSHGVTLKDTGYIAHRGAGETIVGCPKGEKTSRREDVVKFFNQNNVPARSTDNLDGIIWGKLIINVGINALTALTHLHNGGLSEYPDAWEVLEEAVCECHAVIKRKSIDIGHSDPLVKVKEVVSATSGNTSSMLQDILKKKKTEVDYINGAVVKEARGLGIEVPVNKTLWRLVKTMERSYDKQIN